MRATRTVTRLARALVLLVGAVGCKPLDAQQGRYTCDPTGSRDVGSAQCPGQSRCGLEGFCHDVGQTSVRWRCVDAADCEAGWQCGVGVDGVSRECHDPNAPEDFRCLVSADCSGGWTCGLDTARARRCHDPLSPKAWPCDTTTDCVGGWQCGVAATGGRDCHDPKNPQAWVCLSNDDCLGGWECGLNDLRTGRECHDPGAPRAYACQSSTDCVSGWVCGFTDARTSRECHDPRAPRAFACESAGDCVGGWVCGLTDARTSRECHDPRAPRAFACVTDAECVASWDCGLASNRLQRECHDPQNPQRWACAGDDDCLGGFRCDLDGLCVDPRGDALEALPQPDAGAATVLSPVVRSAVTQLAVSPSFTTTTGADLATLAMVREGRLEAITAATSGATRRWVTSFTPAGPVLAAGPRWVRAVPFGNPTQQLVETPYVYAVGPDGGLFGFELLVDGGVITSTVHTPGVGLAGLKGLRHGMPSRLVNGGRSNGSDVPFLVGFFNNPSSYLLFDGPGRGSMVPVLRINVSQPLNPSGNSMLDVADWYLFAENNQGTTRSLHCRFLVDRFGLWANQEDENYDGFEPVHSPAFGNAGCGRTGLQVQRFIAVDSTRAAVVATPWDGGLPLVSVWNLGGRALPAVSQDLFAPTAPRFWCASNANAPCTVGDRIGYDVSLGPCSPCPAGSLLDLSPVVEPGQPVELEARCGSPDGGSFAFYRIAAHPTASGRCVTQLLVGSSSLFSASSLVPAEQVSPGRVSFAGIDGQLWLGRSAVNVASLQFDQSATGVLRLAPSASSRVVVVGETAIAVFTPGLGLVGTSRQTPTAIATNEPGWALQDDRVLSFANAQTIDDGVVIAFPARPLATPQVLVKATTRTNQTVAVLSAGTQLWTAVVEDGVVPPRPPAVLAPRVAAAGLITSLAISTPGPDAGVTFIGYATTSSGLSRLVAASPTSWRVEDVPLPPNPTAKEVWFTQGRARVGLSNGTVLSLPSRVTIAPAIGALVEDYAQGCGRPFALTNQGLFELQGVGAATVGRWAPVSLPVGFGSTGFSSGRLHVVDSDLYVFTSSGDLATVPLGPCP